MAITVQSVNYSKITVSKKDGIFTFVNPATIVVTYTKNKKTYKLNVYLEKGFRTDGASIPSAFTWFLPNAVSEPSLFWYLRTPHFIPRMP